MKNFIITTTKYSAGHLSEKEILVLLLRKMNKTLEEVGQIIGVTRERVRQIEGKAQEIVRQENKNNCYGEN
jgi:DNA-directed RNA polymerase sigma subunit (sigma70/sigma32)